MSYEEISDYEIDTDTLTAASELDLPLEDLVEAPHEPEVFPIVAEAVGATATSASVRESKRTNKTQEAIVRPSARIKRKIFERLVKETDTDPEKLGEAIKCTIGDFSANNVPDFFDVITNVEHTEFKSYRVTTGGKSGVTLDVGTYPVLEKEQEQGLARIIEKGRQAKYLAEQGSRSKKLKPAMLQAAVARQHFINANRRLCLSHAFKTPDDIAGFDSGDALSAAINIGLEKALEKFDYRKGFKFSTYATWWLKQSVQRARGTMANTIRLPTREADSLERAVREAKGDFDELDDEHQFLLSRAATLSLDKSVDASNPDGGKSQDFIADPNVDTEVDAIDSYTTHLIREILAKQRAYYEEIGSKVGCNGIDAFKLRNGLARLVEDDDGSQHMVDTYGHIGRQYVRRQIGEFLGISGERVRHLETDVVYDIKFRLLLSGLISDCRFDDGDIERVKAMVILSPGRERNSIGGGRKHPNDEILTVFRQVYGRDRLMEVVGILAKNEEETRLLKNMLGLVNDKSLSERSFKSATLKARRAKELNFEALAMLCDTDG